MVILFSISSMTAPLLKSIDLSIFMSTLSTSTFRPAFDPSSFRAAASLSSGPLKRCRRVNTLPSLNFPKSFASPRALLTLSGTVAVLAVSRSCSTADVVCSFVSAGSSDPVGFVSSASRSRELSDDSDSTDISIHCSANVHGHQCTDLEPAYAQVNNKSTLSNQFQEYSRPTPSQIK